MWSDAGYIRAEGTDLWQRSFWRILALVVLIVAVTFAMVRWFLMRPMTRVAERLRRLRMGHVEKSDWRWSVRTESSSAAGARSGDDGGEPDCGASRCRGRGPAARCRRKPVDGRATGGAYAGRSDRAGSLWSRTASPTCTCGRGGRRCAWCRPAAWSRRLSRCCGPATAFGWPAAAAMPTDDGGRVRPPARAARRSALHAAPRVALGRRGVADITTVSRTKGCGRCATSRTRGPSSAPATGSATSG